MKIDRKLSETAVLRELGRRAERARLDLNLTQAQLALEAGVSQRTIERLESGASTQLANLLRITRALGRTEGWEPLFPEPVPSPIQQLKTRNEPRRRASGRTAVTKPVRPWTWGDDR